MKVRILVFCIAACFIFEGCTSGTRVLEWSKSSYNIGNPLLLLNANSSVRYNEVTLDVIDAENAVYTSKEALTIFNREHQEDLARTLIWYNQFRKVKYIKANIIDRAGNIVRSLDESDAQDYSSFSAYTFFSDNRVKVLDLFHNSYPYTIEVEYELALKGLLNLPSWYPKGYNQSVEEARFRLIDRSGTGVRYLQKNLDEEPETRIEDGVEVKEWSIKNSMAIKREPYAPPATETLPYISMAPGRFIMDESAGEATTWKSFGKWYYELGKDTRILSDEARKEIDDVVDGLKDEKEIVHKVYHYLQEKTRYVSIQLGIGGWKPFSANSVFEKEYGDCKALTNYMQAALEYLGIKVNPVLIRNGVFDPVVDPDFPSNRFNHVVILVTLENGEEIWLECTSKYMPPGEIGSGNEGKNALLISEDGGKLIRTPESKAEDNVITTTRTISLNEEGVGMLEAYSQRTGIQRQALIHELLPISEKQRREWFEENMPVSDYSIKNLDFSSIDQEKNSELTYSLQLNNYASTSSSRLFVPLNKLNNWDLNPKEQKSRTQGVWLSYRFSEKDSTVFEIPEGFEIETKPSGTTIETEFGSFSTQITEDISGNIVYERELRITEKRLKPEQYNEFREFFRSISKADEQQVVLVKRN